MFVMNCIVKNKIATNYHKGLFKLIRAPAFSNFCITLAQVLKYPEIKSREDNVDCALMVKLGLVWVSMMWNPQGV